MSLEQKIEALTAALLANTAALQGQASSTVAQAAPAPVAQAAPAAFAAPALANGMPGGPFGTPAAAPAPAAFAAFAAPTPAAPAGAPFSDLPGCTKYAMEAFGLLEAKAPGRGEVITQLIQHLCGTASINDLTPAHYPAFYAELEKQKAL